MRAYNIFFGKVTHFILIKSISLEITIATIDMSKTSKIKLNRNNCFEVSAYPLPTNGIGN